MTRILLVLLTCFFTTSTFAQGAKRKVRKEQDRSIKADTSQGEGWLPDWPVPEFDWFVGPVIGFKYTSVSADGQPERKQTTFEGGLTGGLVGVPVVPGNPGFTLSPDAGMAYGYNFYELKDSEGNKTKGSSHYRRQWVGSGETLYVKFFRYHLDLRMGKIQETENSDNVVQSLKVGNDFGFLLRSWLSAHYTLDYLRAYTIGFGDKFLDDYNHWLHARMFFELMSFVVDVGPGFTQTTEYDPILHTKLAKGRTDYFLLKLGLNPFWKVVADGQAKYVYNATEEDLGSHATTRLPEDELTEPTTLSMPEDSFLGSLFLGVKDIVFGVGAGWRTNVQVLNVSRKDGAEKQTTRDQGFGLYYEVRF